MTTRLDTLIAAAIERRVLHEREERARETRERAEHEASLLENFHEWYSGAFLAETRDALAAAGAMVVVPTGKDAACLMWPEGPQTAVGLDGRDGHWMLEFVARAGVAGSVWQLITPTYDYVRVGSERETNLDDVLLCAIADWRVEWPASASATAPAEAPEELLEEVPF